MTRLNVGDTVVYSAHRRGVVRYIGESTVCLEEIEGGIELKGRLILKAKHKVHLPETQDLKVGDPVVSQSGFRYTVLAIHGRQAWCRSAQGDTAIYDLADLAFCARIEVKR